MYMLSRLLSLLCLLALACAACAFAAAADPPPAPAELLKEYRSLGLPLPPEKARLVRYEAGGGGIVNGKVQPTVYALAFEAKPGSRTEHPVLLRGTLQWQPAWDPRARAVEPDASAVKDLEFDADDALVLAIQCHSRGWDQLAGDLLERSLKGNPTPSGKRLVRLAWDYWLDQLTRPKIDRGPVAKRLKDLARQDPMLETPYTRALLRSLDLALVPGKGKPGTVEALIDDLVDHDADAGTLGRFEPGDRYWRVVERGFDAVPALLEHLDDDRLTRAIMQGFNNFRPWHQRVKDVVGDILEGLAAEELDRAADGKSVGGGWLRRQQGYPITPDAGRAWWEKARKLGEEAYLLDRVLPPAAKEGKRAHVNAHLLRVISVKYPKHVPALYRTVLDKRPDLYSGELAEVLARSPVPAKDKLDLFLSAARHKDATHRLPAFHALKNLDKKKFDALLLATIEGFPTDVKGEYWICPEAYIAGLAVESDDARVWAALEKVAQRSSLGLRMELLNHFGDSRDTRRRPERLRLLAAFLDDAEVRDTKSDARFGGPGAGFPYDRIEVRDFVAVELAGLLGVEVELKLERSAAEWAEVRNKVREVLKRELRKLK
jgi:hypothetical protein